MCTQAIARWIQVGGSRERQTWWVRIPIVTQSRGTVALQHVTLQGHFRSLIVTLTSATALLTPALSLAQVTLEPDGRWSYLLTAGANVSSGNNDAGSLNLAAESAQQTPYDKWTWSAKADHARSAGVATTDR